MKGSIRPKAPGVWYLRFDVPSEDGTRKQVRKTFHGTKKDAEKELAQLVLASQSGSYVSDNGLTVAEFLEQWLWDGCEGRLALKTVDFYRSIVRRHLSPTLGKHRLSQLAPAHVARYFSLKRGEGLSGTSLRGHYATLHRALEQAVLWQMVARNVTDAVDAPRTDTAKRNVYDADQLVQLMDLTLGTPYAAPVALSVMAALRRGEVLGLKWEDLDFTRRILHVRRALIYSSKGISFKMPKSGESRAVAIPEVLVEILIRHRGEQAAERLQEMDAWENSGLVCPGAYGAPWHPDRFSKAYGDWLARATLPRFTFHDLRHAHASFLLAEGKALTMVRDRLGHSTIRVTADLYGHTLPPEDQAAADSFDARFGRRKV